MHDAKGRELKVGDRVMIPAEVTSVQPGPDLCNLTVKTIGGRKPDGNRDTITLNCAQVYRANGDTNIETKGDGDHTFLR